MDQWCAGIVAVKWLIGGKDILPDVNQIRPSAGDNSANRPGNSRVCALVAVLGEPRRIHICAAVEQ